MTTSRLRPLDPAAGPSGPAWLDGARAELISELSDPRYPCLFGRAALRQGEVWTTWVESGEPAGLAEDVAEFLDLPPGAPGSRRPLVVLAEPETGRDDEEAYETRFWELLEHLHRHDDRPWPADVPEGPDEPGWQFCFHDVSIFVFALVPTAHRRRSRRLTSCLALVFMPRWVFDGIEVGTVGGDTIRTRIRRRLEAWDDAPLHPSMGGHSEMADDEWRQYFVTDQDEERHERCPFHPAGAARTGARS